MISLMYHDVVPEGAEDSSGFQGRDANSYKVTVARFADHLDAIVRRLSVPAPPAPPVLTFDDGGASAIAAADLLEARGLRGCFFVTANYIGAPAFVGERAVRDLDARGHVVGSHSCSHPLRVGHCSPGQLRDEWHRSREIISRVLGHPISSASVPGGDYAPAVAEAAAQAGFTDLFTSEPTTADRAAFGLRLHGRFTIRRWTTAATAAALAAGDSLPRRQQAFVWSVKKLGKRLGGERYLQLRRLLLGHGPEVRWGDCRD
jgi:peptidoglycan/xylan/chitin deacetylase (PgdA/CDA1 family)